MIKSAKTKLNGQYNPFTQPMVTGHGVHGGPNGSITYDDLVYEATQLTDDERRFEWPSVVKEEAYWFLPSKLTSRNSADQVADGEFIALVVDIDSGSVAFSDVERAALAATCGAVALIYSTKNATYGTPRWRVVIPLEQPLPGEDYTDTAKALYALIREASDGLVNPDDAGARPGQISFLPNAPHGDPDGDNYLAFAAEIGDDPEFALNLVDDHPIVQLREAKRHEKQREADAVAERAKGRRGGGTTLLSRFNAQHRVDELLSRYGYIQATDPSGHWPTDHWRSPYQTSGSYATLVYRDDDGESWVSLSGSDAKRGLGAKSANGGARYGDAFDLFVHFEHGGDSGAALEAWKAHCDADRHLKVKEGLAQRREATAANHDQLRALGRAHIRVSGKDTDNILTALRRLGQRKDKEAKK